MVAGSNPVSPTNERNSPAKPSEFFHGRGTRCWEPKRSPRHEAVAPAVPVSPTFETRSDQRRSGFCFSGFRWIGASVPSDYQWANRQREARHQRRADPRAERRSRSTAIPRIVTVPRCNGMHGQTAGQLEADAGLRRPSEVDATRPGALAKAMKFVGVPLVSAPVELEHPAPERHAHFCQRSRNSPGLRGCPSRNSPPAVT
ncbi:hypothetical protein HNP02_008582 [Mycobacterium sp. AZCC_0083]|nr:hypothetical protein [Mycobacterium sp. AZCC_0083]